MILNAKSIIKGSIIRIYNYFLDNYNVGSEEFTHPLSFGFLIGMMKIRKGRLAARYPKLKRKIIKNYDKDIVETWVENYSKLCLDYVKEYPVSLKDIVLVIGSDTKKNKSSNLNLLEYVKGSHSGQKIYFFGAVENINVVNDNIEVISMRHSPLWYLINASEIYTIDSLWGITALIFNKKITVLGKPIYYNCHGVTLIGCECLNKISVVELIYTYFIHGIVYSSPISNAKLNIYEAIVWSCLCQGEEYQKFFRRKQLLKIENKKFSYSSSIERSKDTLNIMIENGEKEKKILYQMVNIVPPSKLDIEEYFHSTNRISKYYNSFDFLFRKLVEFDKQYEFHENVTEEVSGFFDRLSYKDKNKIVLYLGNSILKSRGRKYKQVLKLPSSIIYYKKEEHKLWMSFLRYYLLRFEYKNVKYMIENCSSSEDQVWFQIATIIHNTEGNNAFRVDTDWYERQNIMEVVANKFSNHYRDKYKTADKYFVSALYFYIVKDEANFNLNCERSFSYGIKDYHKNYVVACLSNLLKFSRYDLILTTLDDDRNFEYKLVMKDLYLNCLVRSGSLNKAKKFITNNDLLYHRFGSILKDKKYLSVCYSISAYYNATNQMYDSFKILKNYRSLALKNGVTLTENVINKLNLNIEKAKFNWESSELINRVENTVISRVKGIVFQTHCVDHQHALSMSIPLLCELKKQGYIIVSLSKELNILKASGMSNIDKYIGYLQYECNDGNIKLNWNIDWENKIVECEGINFYQGIYEQLSIRYRAFDIDIEKPGIKRFLEKTIKQCDLSLRFCKEIASDSNLKRLPIVFLGATSHRAPASVFRDFALSDVSNNIFYTSYNIGYEKYYKGQSTKLSSTLTVLDMSLHRHCRAGFLAIKSRFEHWLADKNNIELATNNIERLISMQRGNASASKGYDSFPRVQSAKKQGKKIICCFGKMTCDLAVPLDGGPGHKDMKDWINHTVNIVEGRDDILLLIKPHPVELVAESALDLQQYFRDLLPDVLPNNVLFLGHNEFNVPELAPHLDLAILYNGTSSMELTILGVPVMMTSYYGKYDYPIDLIYPENRSQYKEYILSGSYLPPSRELKLQAAGLLYYMGTDDVSLEIKITNRSSTNDNIGIPSYNYEEVEAYFSQGNKQISLAASRAVESAEKFINN